MRAARLVSAVAVAGALALSASPAWAGHEESCAGSIGDPTGTGVLYVDNGNGGTNGHLTVGSCDNVPVDGHLTVAGNAEAACGYVVVDGDPSNGPEADGHAGVGFGGGQLFSIGPAEGDYQPSCPHA